MWTSAWMDEGKARTGVSGFIYASPNFWKDKLSDTAAFALSGYRLWVAHWTASSSPLVPASNWGGLGWAVWQPTDCARAPGPPAPIRGRSRWAPARRARP